MRRIRLNALQTLTLGFALLILTGAVLLSLPVATRTGSIPFLDALFTSVSASCVTGLSVFDTFTEFTAFGQVVLILLIQTGGLGFMMILILVSFFLRRRIGLRERSILMESIGALQLGGVVRLARRILLVAGCCETLGAVLLAFWFCPRYGVYGIWLSVFHSISAFCNAGFDLMGVAGEPGVSLAGAADSPLVILTVVFLVLMGGLGYLVWEDLLVQKYHWSRYRLHTKIVLSASVLLILLGTAGFYIMEGDGAFAGLPVGQKLLQALFHAVTPRTAGFSTLPLRNLSQAGMLWMLFLMVVGAGSGSTGGGLKMNTFAVLVSGVLSTARQQRSVNLFGRRLDESTVHRAYTTAAQYFLLSLAGCLVLTLQGIDLVSAMFEVISALSTVGLSLGLTSALPTASKITIMILMFLGRVGSLSVAIVMANRTPAPKLRPPAEKILIG